VVTHLLLVAVVVVRLTRLGNLSTIVVGVAVMARQDDSHTTPQVAVAVL
jgi:hypothetical protein